MYKRPETVTNRLYTKRLSAPVVLLMLTIVAFSPRTVLAQASGTGIPPAPPYWTVEQQNAWNAQRDFCSGLFNEDEARHQMTSDQLAKLPKLSPEQARRRGESFKSCLRMLPPTASSNYRSLK